MEADGEWHTEDDKHGSQGWMGSLANRPRPAEKRVKVEPDTRPSRQSSTDANKPRPAEYLVLDSESEDDMPAPRMSAPTSAGPSRQQSQAQGAVIDLTLSSDDEGPADPPPRPAPPTEPPRAASVSDLKRKERGTTPQDTAWKRPRVEHPANGFVGGQSDDGRTPTREDSGSVRSNSRPPPPNQLAHPTYTHTTSSSAPAGRPDYPGAPYGYPPPHNPINNPYGPRYNNTNGYSGGNRYGGYGSPPFAGEPLPFSSNGRAHPSLPRPHPNPNPGPGPNSSTNRGEPWF